MGGPSKIANFHLNTKKQKTWFWRPLSRKNNLQGVPELDPNIIKAFKRTFKTISKSNQKSISKEVKKPIRLRVKSGGFAKDILQFSKPVLAWEREARLQVW